jgi:hypothetical protein
MHAALSTFAAAIILLEPGLSLIFGYPKLLCSGFPAIYP